VAPDDARLNAAARAIADGDPVDWDGLESTVRDDDRAVVPQFRLVARIAEVHRSLSDPVPPRAPALSATLGEPEASVPAVWGPLVLLERIGSGAYGDVYRARDPRLDREVALKLLRSDRRTADATGDGVINEARLLARVRHPHVVTVHGADLFDGRVGLWMEFIHGRSLEDEIRDRGPVSAEEAAVIGLDLCGALAAVHQSGLVHRDVKAGNVMRENGGRIVLMDFGTGCEQPDPVEPARTGFAGTPLYTAPEVLAGQPATATSDIYSLGVLLYHLVTGAYPVTAHALDDLREAHRRGERRPLRDARSDLPGAFVAVVERALAPDPGDRFPSAGAVETALAAVLVPRPDSVEARSDGDSERSESGPAQRALLGRIVPAAWRGWLAAATVAAVIVAGGLYAYVSWPRTDAAGAALGFRSRDWLLITAFDNRTGDTKLNGTVEYALERELANSHFVSIVPRERVGDALRLMRRPLDTRLDEAIGREVCVRDGGIRAMVSGRVEKLGSVFEVSARVVEPVSGRIVLAAAVGAPGEERILGAVRDLSNQIRASLGEARRDISTSGQDLEKATTPSLKALQLYSHGMALLIQGAPQGQWKAAGELFSQAIKEDPEFASAYVYLSWTMTDDATPHGRAALLAASDRALRLADHATEQERLFIQGSYYAQRKERDKAIAAYEALVRINPNHYWAVNNLAIECAGAGDHVKALPYSLRLAELRPKNSADNFVAATELIIAGRASEAAGFAAQVRALGTKELIDDFPWAADRLAWAECFPIWQEWIRSDVAGAMAAFRLVSARLEDHPARRNLWGRLADWLTTFGRLREADALVTRHIEEASQLEPTFQKPGSPEIFLAWNALLRGDRATARSWMLRFCQRVPAEKRYWWNVLLLARVGLTGEARQALVSTKSWIVGNAEPGDLEFFRGEVALAERRPVEAAALLEQSLKHWAMSDPWRWLAVQSLSNALEAQGDRLAALRVLERVEPAADRSTWVSGDVWLDLQARRARLLRSLGRPAEAEPIEANLRKLLVFADPDLLIVKQLAQHTQ